MKKIASLFVFITFSILYLFAGPSDKHFINGEKWIPADYDPTNTVLLVKKFSYKYTNKKGKEVVVFAKEQAKLEKYMKESYPYEYEFVENTKDSKYEETNKYRYLVVWNTDTHTPSPGARGNGYAGSTGMTISSTGIVCDIRDRKRGVVWVNSGRATSYASGVFSMTINTMLYIYEQRKK